MNTCLRNRLSSHHFRSPIHKLESTMPKRKLAAAAALDSVKKKLRSKLPRRRPRPSHLSTFLKNFTTHRRRFTSSSSTSPFLCCDEPLLSIDDSGRVTLDHILLFPSSSRTARRVGTVTDYGQKSFSDLTAVAASDVVSESSSCVESCSVIFRESSADAIGDRNQVTGFSTLHCTAASEFDVTSHERRPLISGNRFLKPTTVDDDADGGSIVDEGGLVSPIPVNFIDILDGSSFEQDDSDFSPYMYLDSGTDFSERSVGDSAPSLTYSYLLQYRLAFQKSSTPLTAEDVRSNATEWLRLVDCNGEEEECYLSLRSRERRQAYILDYTRHSHSLIKKRLQIVHWIIEQSAKKELQKETMFLGVNLLDRFLSNGNFKSKRNGNLQIAGIACLTLATRIEENQLYNSVHQSTFRMGHNTYSRAEVVAMEWLVQEVLSFKCFLPTVYNFLSFYLKVARADIEMAKNAQHLAGLALLEPEQLSYWPSTVAASLVILSSLPNHYLPHIRVMKAHLRSEDDNIDKCIKSLSFSLKKYT